MCAIVSGFNTAIPWVCWGTTNDLKTGMVLNQQAVEEHTATASEAGLSSSWLPCSPEANELPPDHSNRQPNENVHKRDQ